MGLRVSHGAFNAAASAFNTFRQAVAQAIGGSFPPHAQAEVDLHPEEWYWGDGYSAASHPGLKVFFDQPDGNSEMSPEQCGVVADELTALLPRIEALALEPFGHILRDGGYVAVTQRFIDGCRKAAAAKESLEFM